MTKTIQQYEFMMHVIMLVAYLNGKTMRLYYKGKPSKLSSKEITPLSWSTYNKGATHYVDIPVELVMGMYQCLSVDHINGRRTSYEVYKLKGAANRYAKRSCKTVA
ncbi:hypothetical protein [Paenibacillus taichungensis]